jgi:galactofuranosylgalactofuranosylrhamnosyl-N-acetylglucosaminyl-diphospho-decaprenol beta-1,5/1,6-galactofuranosyltransferase
VIMHRRLKRRWPRLAAEYRAAAGELTSAESWRKTFAASLADPGGAP